MLDLKAVVQDPEGFERRLARRGPEAAALLAPVKTLAAERRERNVALEKLKKAQGEATVRLTLAITMGARAPLGDPALLILDEPTVGLDPEQRMRFRALVSRLGESRTVLLSTHQTEDVAALCERVLVMLSGRLLFDGSPSELARIASGHVWLSEEAAQEAQLSWRTADGRHRTLGDRPPGATPVAPGVEDGYLLLLNDRQDRRVGA